MSVLKPCTEATQSGEAKRLDRAKWHRPLVSIVVTHFNYSTHVRDALLSLLDQTHENWECVIVDYGSEREHRLGVEAIIDDIGSGKIRLLALEENRGQIPAFFAGLDETSGNFVCLLDPDDRYAETFLADALAAHLNDTLFCPILCCDQQLVQNDTVITGSNTWHKMRFLSWQAGNMAPVPQGAAERLLFFPPNAKGWLWTSTSSLMFRRSAVNLMRPNKPLAYKRAADSYLAQGAHLLGGTLFLTKPLIYRRVHPGNSWLNQELFFTCQENGQPNLVNRTSECLVDVIEAIQHNGGAAQLKRNGVLE